MTESNTPTEFESVRILRLEPGDEIVLTLAERSMVAHVEEIRKMAEERWPGHPVTVLANGIDMTVVRKDA